MTDPRHQDKQPEQHRDYRLYGRQQDKPLKPRQQRLMADLLPQIAIAPDDVAAGMNEVAKGFQAVWLEIGFGGGEHLAWQAARHRDTLIIGAEPFNNGVAKLLTQVEEEDLANVRILHGDGRPLIEAMPADSLDRLFVLHPDPWPKKRHHKRRIVSPLLLREAARLLKPGAEMRIASDIPDYIRWTLMQVQMHNRASGDFRWAATRKADWTRRPDDWPQTRYEAKAYREGRVPTYLSFIRTA